MGMGATPATRSGCARGFSCGVLSVGRPEFTLCGAITSSGEACWRDRPVLSPSLSSRDSCGEGCPLWGERPACDGQVQEPRWGSEGPMLEERDSFMTTPASWVSVPRGARRLRGWPWSWEAGNSKKSQRQVPSGRAAHNGGVLPPSTGPCGQPWRVAAIFQNGVPSGGPDGTAGSVERSEEGRRQCQQRPCQQDPTCGQPMAQPGGWLSASEAASPCPGHMGPVPVPLAPLWGWGRLLQESDCPGRDHTTSVPCVCRTWLDRAGAQPLGAWGSGIPCHSRDLALL